MNYPDLDYCDETLVISLEDCEDRQIDVSKKLDRAGISFNFWPAVDGRNGRTFSKDVYDSDAAPSNRFMPTSRQLRGGEVGCALSHLTLYRHMIDSGMSACLVLEDDIDVMPISQETAGLVDNPPPDFDLLYLGVKNNHFLEPFLHSLKRKLFYPLKRKYASRHRVAKFTGAELGRIFPRRHHSGWLAAGAHHGTHAYIVSRSGAGKIYAANFPVKLPADLVLNELVVSGALRAYLSPEAVFRQCEDRYSTIDNPV